MEKVLVTGGSGFFGSHLIKELLNKNCHVKVLDIEDLENSGVKEKVEFIKGDIRDKEIVKEMCKGIDYTFHGAAIQPISRSKKKIFREINVDGTRNVLDASLYNNVKKVVFISSSAPYGIPKECPITEDTEFNPIWHYGCSKIEAERICNEYRNKGLNTIILRPRVLIGKGRLGIFQILYSWIADNKNIYIIGKADNLYQHLSVKDLINACILSIEKDCKNEDYNLGADKFTTVREELQELIDYAKSSSKIILLPANFAKTILKFLDIFNLVPFTPWHYMTADKPFYFDITKARKNLGWQPEMSNIDMLKESYDWYISNRKEIDSEFGVTHSKVARQRILKILKILS